MGLLERVIRALIYLCFLAIAFYLVIWVLGALGIALPAMVVKILGIVVVLVAILVLVRMFAGSFANGPGGRWWP